MPNCRHFQACFSSFQNETTILNRFGERVLEGGDMYEQEQKHFDFMANRPLSKIDQCAETLSCPIVHIDGTGDWRINAQNIAERWRKDNVD